MMHFQSQHYVGLIWPWPWKLKLMHIIPRGMDNLSTNFGVSRTFLSRLIGQHLSAASCDLATMNFNFGSHGTSCWCGSSCSVCVPSLKFVGLPIRKILRIYCMSISRPGDLDLWPWNRYAISPVGWTTFLLILVFLGRFVLDLSANNCQTCQVTLRPWPLSLEVTALVTDAGLSAPSMYQVWTS